MSHLVINADGTAVDLCTANVTLNGHRAQVAGYNREFAVVTDLSNGLSAEWAWSTVDFIVAERDGKFHS
jgi:hypothetical protein